MAYSDVLATLALVVSLLTAAWAGWRNWRWDRPVISITGEQWIAGGDYNSTDVVRAGFRIDIVNRGNLATQITDAYWEIDRGNGTQIRLSSSLGGVDSLFEDESRNDAPSFPFTLDRYQRKTWDFEMNTRGWLDKEGIVRCRPVVDFVSRRSIEHAYGEWEPSQIAIQAKHARKMSEETDLSDFG